MTPPSDESPASSFARVAAAAEQAGPPPPSPQTVAQRELEAALGHLRAVGRFASHSPTCEKDTSPEAILSGRLVLCSCGLDQALAAAAAFVAKVGL